MSTDNPKSLLRRYYEEIASTGDAGRVEEFIVSRPSWKWTVPPNR
jgi:hypothetical protein